MDPRNKNQNNFMFNKDVALSVRDKKTHDVISIYYNRNKNN